MWDALTKFLVRFFALIGFVTVGGFVLLVILIKALSPEHKAGKPIEAHTILELQLTELPHEVLQDPLAELKPSPQLTLFNIVEAIDHASRDAHIDAMVLYVNLPEAGIVGYAKIQEVRDAIIEFRKTGKKVYALTDTFGEGFSGNQAYYLASACDEIFLQPSGDVGLNGLVWEEPFLKDGLGHWGVEMDVFQRHEYKTALNSFSQTGFTSAHRETVESVLKSLIDQIAQGISQGRNLDKNRVTELVDQGPFLAKTALDLKLVDHLMYRDEAMAHIKEKSGKDAHLLYLHKYFNQIDNDEDGSVVALVYGLGPVMRGSSEPTPFSAFEDPQMRAEDVSYALRMARMDEDVDAILFRVDSPGGSYVASDTIWRETVNIRQSGKPLVVSMGNIAGSGGYFVAMSANKIVAQPGTLTGSIGVVSAKFKTKPFWEKMHIHWDSAQEGANANMLSSIHDLSELQRKKMNNVLDVIYGDFVAKAAKGRNMSYDQMHALAKGRLWTGKQAHESGLVDDVGGYTTALKYIRQELGLKDSDKVTVRMYPPQPTLVEQIIGSDPDSSEDASGPAYPFELSLPHEIKMMRGIKNQLFDQEVLTMPLPVR